MGWLVRRDADKREGAKESTLLDEIERRVHVLETNAITERDFESFSKRLGDIHADLREMRSFQISAILQARKERES